MGHAKKLFGNLSLSDESTLNREGFPAFKRDWKEEYLQMLLCNTMSNTFYADSRELCANALELHRFAADEDPVFMAQSLVYARNEGFMRLQPLVGLAVLSLSSPTLFARAFKRVVRIVPDLAEFSLVMESLGRGQGGRAVKRAAQAFLNGLDEYAAMKYAGKGRGYSLYDLLRVYHPNPKSDKTDRLFRYAAGRLKWDEDAKQSLPQLFAYARLKALNAGQANEDEAVWLIRAGRLPDNVVTGVCPKVGKPVWQALLPDMPLFSLLRHLATLARNGVIGEERDDLVASRLTDAAAIRRAKILPFRFVSAWRELSALSPCPDGGRWWLLKALEHAVETSVDSMPALPGRTAVMLDISASMQGRFLDAGSVLALSLLRKTGGRGRFMLFNDESLDVQVDPEESIVSAASKITARGCTDTGACVRQLIREKDSCDTLIIITDEQQNTGSAFYRELQKYRAAVNPQARAFVIDVSPYGTAMTPPADEKTWYCYGWSDTTVSFIARALQGYGDLVETVSNINLADEGMGNSA